MRYRRAARDTWPPRPASGASLQPRAYVPPTTDVPRLPPTGGPSADPAAQRRLAPAYVLEPDATRRNDAMLPFKLLADDSGGSTSICEFTLGPWDSGPVLHAHDAVDEAFYVVHGLLEAQVGERRVQALEGSFLWIPRGTAHTFANAGEELLRVLAIATPGGIEHMFAEQAAHLRDTAGHPSPEVMSEIGLRHGSPTLGPPIRSAGAAG